MAARLLSFVVIIVATLTPAPWGEADEISELKERLAIVEQRLDRMEAYRIVDKHVCTDENQQAFDFATNYAADYYGLNYSVPALWDGTPFIVDISSTFDNAHELLDVVTEESERIREFLGYEIFVAGDVLPLGDVSSSYLANDVPNSRIPEFAPPRQHMEILCCETRDSPYATAFPSIRIATLSITHPEHASIPSRNAIIHELYHLLGFVHPDDPVGVVMSDPLMHGDDKVKAWVTVDDKRGWVPTTRSTPFDLAQLACIFNEATTPVGQDAVAAAGSSAATRPHASGLPHR